VELKERFKVRGEQIILLPLKNSICISGILNGSLSPDQTKRLAEKKISSYFQTMDQLYKYVYKWIENGSIELSGTILCCAIHGMYDKTFYIVNRLNERVLFIPFPISSDKICFISLFI